MSDTTEQASTSRRSLLKQSALALAGAGLYGAAPFYGPVEAQPRLGAGGAEEAAGDRPDHGRLGPVRAHRAARSAWAR